MSLSHIDRTHPDCFLESTPEHLFSEIRNPELAGPVRRKRSNFVNGVKETPVRFDPGARSKSASH